MCSQVKHVVMALEVVIITGHEMKLVQCYIGDVFHF